MLRALKKRVVRQRIQREAEARTETRDAILWDILPGRKCRVKIQGSNALIVATYPENWEEKPAWLKPGNAVKILHTAGNRNRIELIGHGQAIPTPVAGAMLPPVAPGQDGLLSDGYVHALPEPGMYVWIQTGIYRIGGVTLVLQAMAATEDNMANAGMGVPIDITAAVRAVDAAHASLWRYDIFAIGADGVIDYIKGTAGAGPTMPATPTNHVRLGYVLVPPGVTEITGDLVNRGYTEPFVSQLVVTAADMDLAWGENSTAITVTVQDQYGHTMTAQPWWIDAEITSGSGFINDAALAQTANKRTDNGQAVFTYTRDTSGTEASPRIEFRLVENAELFGLAIIVLRDMTGDIL